MAPSAGRTPFRVKVVASTVTTGLYVEGRIKMDRPSDTGWPVAAMAIRSDLIRVLSFAQVTEAATSRWTAWRVSWGPRVPLRT